MIQALVVEDDPQVAQINCGYLEQSGFAVAGVAADARRALALLQTVPVQLVLLDIYLPGESGLQILRELRAGRSQIEVIVISAAKDSTQIREAFRMGCLDYIIKPFTYERLLNALNKFRQKMELLQKDFLDQSEVDLLASRQPQDAEPPLPKGIDKTTLKLACACALRVKSPFSVQELADEVQISRVSTKKYLDFLCEQKALQQTYIYGNKGRPANLYRVAPTGEAIIHAGLERWLRD